MKGKGIGGEAGNDQRRKQGGGAGNGKDRLAGFCQSPDERKAGIGEQRRAGIGDQRNGLPGGYPGDDVIGLGPLIVFMQGNAPPLDAIVVEQTRRHARILAEDRRRSGQGLERADGDVAQIADRGRHDIEPRRQGRGGKGGAGDEIARNGIRHAPAVRPVENWLSNAVLDVNSLLANSGQAWLRIECHVMA